VERQEVHNEETNEDIVGHGDQRLVVRRHQQPKKRPRAMAGPSRSWPPPEDGCLASPLLQCTRDRQEQFCERNPERTDVRQKPKRAVTSGKQEETLRGCQADSLPGDGKANGRILH
jgi:hypothetical protein